MNISDEKASLCAFGKIFGFKSRISLALISHFGSARAVFNMSTDEKTLLLGPHSSFSDSICIQRLDEAYDELRRLHSQGIHYTGWTEEDYPSLLKECEDAPTGLYIRSETPAPVLWKPLDKIAIIGTRDISPYGREWCERIVDTLSSSGNKPAIISGLALGTDICAHKRALDTGLPTIGVMATGPEVIYPHRNEGTAKRMISAPGCALVTDYPPGTAPLAINFLRRNRIIAGLSQASILIESKLKGGGMMTSRIAFSYNRDVYALPGRIDDIRSQGCNLLIKKKIAEPIICPHDLMDCLGIHSLPKAPSLSDRARLENIYGKLYDQSIIDAMNTIIGLTRQNRGVTLEEISEHISLPYHKTANLCSILESDGILNIDLLQRCSINADFS